MDFVWKGPGCSGPLCSLLPGLCLVFYGSNRLAASVVWGARHERQEVVDDVEGHLRHLDEMVRAG